MSRRPSICIISLSAIADDPRVRRQGDAFYDAGWTVSAVGLPGARSSPPPWRILTRDNLIEAQTNQAPSEALLPSVAAVPEDARPNAPPTLHRSAEYTNAVKLLPAVLQSCRYLHYRLRHYFLWLKNTVMRLEREAEQKFISLTRKQHGANIVALFYYSVNKASLNGIRKLITIFFFGRNLIQHIKQVMIFIKPEKGPDLYLESPEIRRHYEVTRLVKADVYLANDWHTLPIAMRAARETGGHFCYDTHEYALEEYRYRPWWRLLWRPLILAIEGAGLRDALVKSTVSAGIAENVAREYGLPEPLLVFRNTPNRQAVKYRQCEKTIKVLFHGLIVPDRGLESCIRSVALWRPEFKFILRGPISRAYRSELDAIAQFCGVKDRIEFLPTVPMTELIQNASMADIGISTPPRTSKHNIYALPNKFFEYIQSGLALAVADLPEMARILKQYDLGMLIKEVTPESIAQTINSFSYEKVNYFKKNSQKAALKLNWEVECQLMTTAYNKAIEATQAQQKRNSG